MPICETHIIRTLSNQMYHICKGKKPDPAGAVKNTNGTRARQFKCHGIQSMTQMFFAAFALFSVKYKFINRSELSSE